MRLSPHRKNGTLKRLYAALRGGISRSDVQLVQIQIQYSIVLSYRDILVFQYFPPPRARMTHLLSADSPLITVEGMLITWLSDELCWVSGPEPSARVCDSNLGRFLILDSFCES